jgi:hypothetical protein
VNVGSCWSARADTAGRQQRWPSRAKELHDPVDGIARPGAASMPSKNIGPAADGRHRCRVRLRNGRPAKRVSPGRVSTTGPIRRPRSNACKLGTTPSPWPGQFPTGNTRVRFDDTVHDAWHQVRRLPDAWAQDDRGVAAGHGTAASSGGLCGTVFPSGTVKSQYPSTRAYRAGHSLHDAASADHIRSPWHRGQTSKAAIAGAPGRIRVVAPVPRTGVQRCASTY